MCCGQGVANKPTRFQSTWYESISSDEWDLKLVQRIVDDNGQANRARLAIIDWELH